MEFARHVAATPAHGSITRRRLRFETRLDEFISSFPLAVLCRYDAQQFGVRTLVVAVQQRYGPWPWTATA